MMSVLVSSLHSTHVFSHFDTERKVSSSSASSSFQKEHKHPTTQLLLRFQNKTHVINAPLPASLTTTSETTTINKDHEALMTEMLRLWLIQHWSHRTGWQPHQLRIRSWQLPFVELDVVSSIRGGKGGFGTLLKGQSRQAGAKLTTDFGACRDLQGRRLRHVNDEIKLRKWREMQRAKAAGETVPDDILWNTPSGIYNWHLMTPTWADISKKATYRIKRQFQKMDKEEQKKQLLRQEQEEAYQKSLTHYLEQATNATATIQEDLQDALKQGLTKKRKRTAAAATAATKIPMDYQPNSLCTLSGDAVVVTKKDGASVEMQSKSDFCTAVLVLDQPIPKDQPIVYYEVSLESGGMAQIGWACLVGDEVTFQPNDDLGDGVGDDAASFGVDGSRSLKFHAGTEETYPLKWKQGDRLGCSWDTETGIISFQINGTDCGVAFTTKISSLVPAFSCNQGEILELHTAKTACMHFPEKAIAVGEMITSVDEIDTKLEPSDAKKPAVTSNSANKSTNETNSKNDTQTKPTSMKEEIKKAQFDTENIKPLDLESFNSAKELEALGMDRLKGALMSIKVKCGGTLEERAARLFSLKGLERKDYPKKVRAKGFLEY